MRRADRLFSLVLELRRRDVVTAQQLADRLEVSVRTVYRDIEDLRGSGIPIDGEAGVGYVLRHGAELSPMAFTTTEVDALVLGARMVEAWGDTDLRVAARSSLAKIQASLPPSERHRVDDAALHVPTFNIDERDRPHMTAVRRAIEKRRVLTIRYVDAKDRESIRDIRPLGLFHWSGAWAIGAWCEAREDHRNFLLRRCEELVTTPRTFTDESPWTLDDFLVAMTRR